jgi:hypothetical protein
MLLRQAVVLAALPCVVAVVISILPGAPAEPLIAPRVLAGLAALAESLFAAAPLILPLFVFVIPAALVAETVPLLELQPAAAVPALLQPMTLA